MIVAIDGAVATGKTTVGLAVARARDLGYFNTGSTYRAAAWWCDAQGVPAEDKAAVIQVVAGLSIEAALNPDGQQLMVNGVSRGREIHALRAPALLATIAAIPEVRRHLVEVQRTVVRLGLREYRGVVVDGRDVNAVVLPDADVKLLFIADDAVRSARRRRQLGLSTGASVDDVLLRDRIDSRVSDFFTAPPGVEVIDTSTATIQETVDRVLRLVDDALQDANKPRTL